MNKTNVITHTCRTIRRTALHSVVTREETKTYKAISMKRKFIGEDISYPYGFKQRKN